MKTITFESKPRTEKASSVPGDTMLRLVRAATTTDGERIPAGTRMQPKSHGNQGYAYTVIA